MKAIINLKNPTKEQVEKIIEHFVAYDIDDFILYVTYPQYIIDGKDLLYYITNGIKITCVNDNGKESTAIKLINLKGSLEEPFFVVYSSDACQIELDSLILSHKEQGSTATIGIANEKMVTVLFEPQVFDYISEEMSLEKDVLERIGQDLDLNVYKSEEITA
ncbi:MAG: hypothetical protein IJ309_05910 [Clostridia bacterium]|nr:hypothetical protein [Clostridia bacterium]